jgi:3-dehydroquinate synthase
MAEVIKYAAICKKELGVSLENGIDIEEIIAQCVSIKSDIVQRDERDTGERQLLNFGHTLAHSVEKCSGFEIPHGSAVAIGMVIATKGAYEIGLSDEDYSNVLLPILKANNLPTSCGFSAKALADVALSDKKRSQDTISLIVPEKYGLCKIEKIHIDKLQDFIELGLK